MARPKKRPIIRPTNLQGYGANLKRVISPSKDNPLLIAFTGKLCSGKGTACSYVHDMFGGIKVAWADGVKIEAFDVIMKGSVPKELVEHSVVGSSIGFEALCAFQNAPRCKTVLPTDKEKIAWINANKALLRPYLQWHGTDYRRGQDKEYWVKRGLVKIKEALSEGSACITNDDTRYPNEAQALIANGFIICRILTSEDDQETRATTRDGGFDPNSREHMSETSLDTFYHPYTIYNDSSIFTFKKRVQAMVLKVLNPRRSLQSTSVQAKLELLKKESIS